MFFQKSNKQQPICRTVKRLLGITIFSLLSGCGLLPSFTSEPPEDEEKALNANIAPSIIALNTPIIPVVEPRETDDIWGAIRKDFTLSKYDHSRISKYEQWYAKNQGYIDRVVERGSPYLHYIVKRMKEENLPLELALLPIVESAFDPFAYSRSRASGIWQFLSSTGKDYGLEQNWWYDGRRDIVASTEAAIRYLKRLNKIFDGDWLLALAAYNSGQGKVSRAIRSNRKNGKPTDFWSLQLPRETRAYVPQLLALARVINLPEEYNITLPPLLNEPYFTVVNTHSQIDLAQAAELAGIEINQLYLLNPGFNRWATDPKGPHQLLLPITQAGKFNAALQAIPAEQRVSWKRYAIQPGDSLIRIAKKFNTSVDTLKITNQLSTSRIRAGKTLLIPTASAPNNHYVYSKPERVKHKQTTSKGAKGSRRIHYVVKSGDSFWRIAQKHKVTVAALVGWNAMAPRDTLKPGKTLIIWSKNTKLVAVSKNTSSNGVIRKLKYKVRSGDSLARIANKFKIKMADISRWNKVSTKDYIHPGQSITLFVDVTGTQ